METWPTVIIAGIVAFASLFAAFMQNRHSSKRFERELERAREIDYHKRRWKVRSESLLKLRAELARMAAKNHKMLVSASMLHTNIFSGATEEQIKEWLDTAIKDWNSYVDSGEFEQVLFTVDDKDIADKVEQLRLEYKRAYIKNIHWRNLPTEELAKVLDLPKELKEDVREVQELINKRLDEL